MIITTAETVIERIGAAIGNGEDLRTLAKKAAHDLGEINREEIGAVIAAAFSKELRFPSLAVEIAAELGLQPQTAAIDLDMACSAYPYAVYLAGKLCTDFGKKAIVIDGDVQSRLVDKTDHATGAIFSDAVTASLVSVNSGGQSPNSGGQSRWSFLSRDDEALTCPGTGPIRMDGMKVFSFVATEVSKMLKEFLATAGEIDVFAPHQANPYMVRQLAKSLGLSDRLIVLPEEMKNPGSASIALALKYNAVKGRRALIAGFGAGYSAAVGTVYVL